jgi:hypothetical protein
MRIWGSLSSARYGTAFSSRWQRRWRSGVVEIFLQQCRETAGGQYCDSDVESAGDPATYREKGEDGDHTRRFRLTRRPWWRVLRARGSLGAWEFLAEVLPADGEIQPRMKLTSWCARIDETMSERFARLR